MGFKSMFEKLKKEKKFKDFKLKYPKAYLCAAFFTLNQMGEIETQEIDFSLSGGKIATFSVNEKVACKFSKEEEKKFLKINPEIKIDLEKVLEISKKNLRLKEEPQRIIAILQFSKEKQIWNLIYLLPELEIIILHVDPFSGKILKKETKSIFEFVEYRK